MIRSIIVLILFLSSCAAHRSASWNIKRAKFHQLIAESKGAEMAVDTVFKEKIVEVNVPGDTIRVVITPKVDVPTFDNTMFSNDSLVLAIDSLHKDIASGNSIDKEKTMARLAEATREIKRLKGRILMGFVQDSVYHVEVDSITAVDIEFFEGQLRNVTLRRQNTNLKQTETLPIEIRNILSLGYKWWQVLVAGLCLAMIFFLFGYFTGKRDDE